MRRFIAPAALTLLLATAPATSPSFASSPAPANSDAAVTHYRRTTVEGVDIFYREAGPKDAPAILLLHGFPTSSRMFRNLIPVLAKHYRVVAPDYPGFGHSATPDRKLFTYSFASFAKLVDGLATSLGLQRYALYVQDYGAPVGYRLALRHPERITALVIQNGNAYDEGLSPFWDPIRAYWATPTSRNRDALRAGLTLEATRSQYVDGVQEPSRIDPDNWLVDQVLLDRPGIDEIMLDLFRDYATNVTLYPQFQQFFRKHQPPSLIVWGKHDIIFPASGAHAYLRDLPAAELHLLDSGHFALEDKASEIASLMKDFLDRKLRP